MTFTDKYYLTIFSILLCGGSIGLFSAIVVDKIEEIKVTPRLVGEHSQIMIVEFKIEQPELVIVEPVPVIIAQGKASYYGGYHNGRRTANGEVFDENGLTAAYMDVPFGTQLKVTNTANGKSVVVKVTDRGGFKRLGRVIDLSKGSFQQIANTSQGIINVKIEKL